MPIPDSKTNLPPASSPERNLSPRTLRRNRFVGLCLGRYFRVLGATLRVRWHNQDALLAAATRGHSGGVGAAVAFWHGDLAIPVIVLRDRKHVGLVSRSADGEIIAAALQTLGWQTRRGSQFWGGVEAVRSVMKALRDGHIVAITPDGPRGPSRIAAPGAEFITARVGCELFPLGIAAQSWHFKTWDSFQLPRPFARVEIVVGNPIQISLKQSQSTLDGVSALQIAIEECNQQARRLLEVR